MKILVTGAAGFIGSHLCEKLLEDPAFQVIGLDGLIPSSTPVAMRENNLKDVLLHPRFTFMRENLLTADWAHILPGVDLIYHLAGMPGVRSSWGEDFKQYIDHNIAATQRLLEGCRNFPIQKFIYASTSSVYGEQLGQVSEHATTSPLSPYGVSKLTGEHLCKVYAQTAKLPLVILRFFTVYGPRQRPDMAFHKFFAHALEGKPIPLNGDGTQTRDFTYVQDCVTAIASTAKADPALLIGETINIGGKERASVLTCLAIMEQLLGRPIDVQFMGKPIGEPSHTWADIQKAQRLLGYAPQTALAAGLEAEFRFVTALSASPNTQKSRLSSD